MFNSPFKTITIIFLISQIKAAIQPSAIALMLEASPLKHDAITTETIAKTTHIIVKTKIEIALLFILFASSILIFLGKYFASKKHIGEQYK